ncbi:hypothetical protein VTO73DRAFT_12316 [Trametes versicolor]
MAGAPKNPMARRIMYRFRVCARHQKFKLSTPRTGSRPLSSTAAGRPCSKIPASLADGSRERLENTTPWPRAPRRIHPATFSAVGGENIGVVTGDFIGNLDTTPTPHALPPPAPSGGAKHVRHAYPSPPTHVARRPAPP